MSNAIPDGTFVEAISKLTAPSVSALPRGRYVVFADGKYQIEGEGPALAEPKVLELTTLAGIVDYVKHGLSDAPAAIAVHVASPTCVQVVAPVVGDERQRFIYARATAITGEHHWGHYQDTENFIINLLSNFSDTEDRTKILRYIGGLTAGLAAEIVDDGISQTTTSRKGITRVGEPVTVPSPAQLAPFRTFAEIEQPISSFVFRLKSHNEGPEKLTASAALYEADGGAWRAQAISDIGEYLRSHLPKGTIVLA